MSLVSLQRLVVCLEESIYIHNIKDMKLLKTILDTPPNPTGKHGKSREQLCRSFAEPEHSCENLNQTVLCGS